MEYTDRELLDKAKEAMVYSYSPYSRFKVGACVLTKDGHIYTGCNIENQALVRLTVQKGQQYSRL
jgi:cytidine deaminase